MKIIRFRRAAVDPNFLYYDGRVVAVLVDTELGGSMRAFYADAPKSDLPEDLTPGRTGELLAAVVRAVGGHHSGYGHGHFLTPYFGQLVGAGGYIGPTGFVGTGRMAHGNHVCREWQMMPPPYVKRNRQSEKIPGGFKLSFDAEIASESPWLGHFSKVVQRRSLSWNGQGDVDPYRFSGHMGLRPGWFGYAMLDPIGRPWLFVQSSQRDTRLDLLVRYKDAWRPVPGFDIGLYDLVVRVRAGRLVATGRAEPLGDRIVRVGRVYGVSKPDEVPAFERSFDLALDGRQVAIAPGGQTACVLRNTSHAGNHLGWVLDL
jgi:hypothetical protein